MTESLMFILNLVVEFHEKLNDSSKESVLSDWSAVNKKNSATIKIGSLNGLNGAYLTTGHLPSRHFLQLNFRVDTSLSNWSGIEKQTNQNQYQYQRFNFCEPFSAVCICIWLLCMCQKIIH